MTTPVCPRCGAELPAKKPKGRRAVWCSQRCRRAAYEERRAAASGAVSPGAAARIVLENPRACAEVMDCLAIAATKGKLDPDTYQPAIAAAGVLVAALHAARLLD